MELPEHILMVASDRSSMQPVTEFFQRQSRSVVFTEDVVELFRIFSKQSFGYALIECEFKKLQGAYTIQRLRKIARTRKEHLPCLLTTFKRDEISPTFIRTVDELRGADVLPMPFTPPRILSYMVRVPTYIKEQTLIAALRERIDSHFMENPGEWSSELSDLVKKALPKLGPPGMSLMALLYQRGERYEEGLAIVDALIVKQGKKNDPRLLTHRGEMLVGLDRKEEALESLNTAHEAASLNIARQMLILELSIELGRAEEATEIATMLAKAYPDSVEDRMQIVEGMQRAGMEDEASQVVSEIAGDEEIAGYLNNRACGFADAKDTARAIESFLEAVKYGEKADSASVGQIHFNLALTYWNSKEKDAKRLVQKHLDRAVKFGFAKRATRCLDLLKSGGGPPTGEDATLELVD